MRKLSCLFLVAAGIVALFASERDSAAKLTARDQSKSSLEKYERLVEPLVKSGQTNLVDQIDDLVSQMYNEQGTVEISSTVRILRDLRAGRTNDAIRLLETRLDSALVAYKISPGTEKVVIAAKDYRAKFPWKTSSPIIDEAVAKTLSSVSP